MVNFSSQIQNNVNVKCKLCKRYIQNYLAGACKLCVTTLFEDDNVSITKTAKLLGLSTATLVGFEKDGRLPAARNSVGARVYSMQSVITYLESLDEHQLSRLLKGKDAYPSIDDEFDTYSAFTPTTCGRCGTEEVYDRNYCISCLDNFISKVQAAAILGCTGVMLQRLCIKYADLLPLFPYGTRVRLNYDDVLRFKELNPDIKKIKVKWSKSALKCRVCKSIDKPHYGGGMCEPCYQDSKEYVVINGYMHGQSLSELGDAIGVSRERARQLFEKAVKIESEIINPDRPQLSIYELREQLIKENKRNKAARNFKDEIEERYDDIISNLSSKNIFNESGLLDILNMPTSALILIRAQYPEFIEIISGNTKPWSWKYDKCKKCETMEVPHKRWGYCQNCYTNTAEWRETQATYRQNHAEAIKDRSRKYSAVYLKRPEVRAKLQSRAHEKHFDGNRELAITNYSSRCADCKIPRETYREINSKDLSVFHLDYDKDNNVITNLIPLCASCLSKRTKSSHSLRT